MMAKTRDFSLGYSTVRLHSKRSKMLSYSLMTTMDARFTLTCIVGLILHPCATVDPPMTPAMPFDDLQRPPSTLLGSPAEFRACIARSKPRDSLAGHRGFVGLASIRSRSWIRRSDRVQLTVEPRSEHPRQ